MALHNARRRIGDHGRADRGVPRALLRDGVEGPGGEEGAVWADPDRPERFQGDQRHAGPTGGSGVKGKWGGRCARPCV